MTQAQVLSFPDKVLDLHFPRPFHKITQISLYDTTYFYEFSTGVPNPSGYYTPLQFKHNSSLDNQIWL